FGALHAGARGYLVKGADRDEIIRAIRAVANGDLVIGRGIAGRALAYFAAAPTQPRRPSTPRTHRSRTRGPDPDGRRLHQPPDRDSPLLSEKAVQPRLAHTLP